MGQLVDEGDIRPSGEHAVEVQLGPPDPSVQDRAPGKDLKFIDGSFGTGSTVSLDQHDDNVGAFGAPSLTLAQHSHGLADAYCRAEQNVQATPTIMCLTRIFAHDAIDPSQYAPRRPCRGHAARSALLW